MKFDVIVGNPPYQLSDGGGTGSSAMPIYQYFVQQAKRLSPKYMSFIIPSRWFSGGKGLDSFREEMLNDKRIKKIVDYPNANDCFPGVEIKGGVSYFIWQKDYAGDCEMVTVQGDEEVSSMKRSLNEWDTLIRWNQAVPILRKIQSYHEATMDTLISSRRPFNFNSNFTKFDQINNPDKVKIYLLGGKSGYVQKSLVQTNQSLMNSEKVLLAKAGSINGTYPTNVIGTLFVADTPSVCTETFLAAGPFRNKEESENFVAFMKTRFARFLLLLKTPTQNISKTCFEFVPKLPMNKPWTDKELFDKYDISPTEQEFIKSLVKEM